MAGLWCVAVLMMADKWIIWWILFAVVAANIENAPTQKPQARYLPHGIQLMPTAPHPARRNKPGPQPYGIPPSGSFPRQMHPQPGQQLFFPPPGAPGYGRVNRPLQGQFRPQGIPIVVQELFRDPPLVTRQVLGPPPPGFDLSQLDNAPQRVFGPQPGPQRLLNPWYALPVPTAVGPYDRKMKRMPVRPMQQLQTAPPLSPLRDIDDPTKTKPPPFDSWQGAQQTGLVPPAPAPDQLAPLAPPRMRGHKKNARRPKGQGQQRGQAPVDEPSTEYRPPMSGEKGYMRSSTRPPFSYKFRGFLHESTTAPPPPALLDTDDMMEEEVLPETDISLFSDGKPAKIVLNPTNSIDYLLL